MARICKRIEILINEEKNMLTRTVNPFRDVDSFKWDVIVINVCFVLFIIPPNVTICIIIPRLPFPVVRK